LAFTIFLSDKNVAPFLEPLEILPQDIFLCDDGHHFFDQLVPIPRPQIPQIPIQSLAKSISLFEFLLGLTILKKKKNYEFYVSNYAIEIQRSIKPLKLIINFLLFIRVPIVRQLRGFFANTLQ
jgi:hypothetical protein